VQHHEDAEGSHEQEEDQLPELLRVLAEAAKSLDKSPSYQTAGNTRKTNFKAPNQHPLFVHWDEQKQ